MPDDATSTAHQELAKIIQLNADGNGVAAGIEWEKPRDIRVTGPDWLHGVFPELDAWIDNVADMHQVPRSMVGMSLIGGMSTLIRRRLRVEIDNGAWSVPVNTYIMITAAPGENKTSTLGRVRKPLEALEAGWQAEITPLFADWKNQHQVLKKKHSSVLTALASPDAKGAKQAALEDDFRTLTRELAEWEAARPIVPRLLVDDATPEALNMVMARQGGVIATLSSEGTLIENLLGRYSKGSNLNGTLKSWDGGEDLVIDRVSRMDGDDGDNSIIVHNPCQTILLMVQPHILKLMGASADMTGKGLAPRFLFCVPDTRVGYRASFKEVSWAGVLQWADVVSRVEGCLSGISTFTPYVMRMDMEASQMFLQARERWEIERRQGGTHEPMLDWSQKLQSQAARIAGLIAALRTVVRGGAEWTVTGEDMGRALPFIEWSIEHALAAHNDFDTRTDKSLGKLRWLLDFFIAKLDEGVESLAHAKARIEINTSHRVYGDTNEMADWMIKCARNGWIKITNNSAGVPVSKWLYVINPAISELRRLEP